MYGVDFNHAGLSGGLVIRRARRRRADVVPATFINFGTISFVTPSRNLQG